MRTGCDDPRAVWCVLVDVLAPCFDIGPLGLAAEFVVTQVDIVGVSSAIHLDLDDLDPE